VLIIRCFGPAVNTGISQLTQSACKILQGDFERNGDFTPIIHPEHAAGSVLVQSETEEQRFPLV
jgi:hypothetical protein